MQSFNVAGQGPFPVKIEDFSSCNGLLPVSNVHPLSVTDLLQREDYCCYKREGQLKMKSNQPITIKRTSNAQANIFKRSQLLVVKILSAIQFKCKRATRLPSRAAHKYSYFNASALQKLSASFRPQNLTWENNLFFLCVVFLLFSPSPYFSVFSFFRAH